MLQPFPRNFFTHRILTIMLIALCFTWFYQHVYRRVLIGGKTMVMEDATQKSIITLRKNFDRGKVKSLRFYISGKIDGKAGVELLHEQSKRLHFSIGPGKVQSPQEIAWEDDAVTLVYSPENVSQGTLSIRYQFVTDKK